MIHFIHYLQNRIEEKSTWAAIVLAITGGSVLPTPYSWLVIAAGVIGAIVPTSGDKNDA